MATVQKAVKGSKRREPIISKIAKGLNSFEQRVGQFINRISNRLTRIRKERARKRLANALDVNKVMSRMSDNGKVAFVNHLATGMPLRADNFSFSYDTRAYDKGIDNYYHTTKNDNKLYNNFRISLIKHEYTHWKPHYLWLYFDKDRREKLSEAKSYLKDNNIPLTTPWTNHTSVYRDMNYYKYDMGSERLLTEYKGINNRGFVRALRQSSIPAHSPSVWNNAGSANRSMIENRYKKTGHIKRSQGFGHTLS